MDNRDDSVEKALRIRLPNRLVNKLKHFSKDIQRNEAYVIRSALEKYFQECADYQIALDRLNDKKDKIITSSELKKHRGYIYMNIRYVVDKKGKPTDVLMNIEECEELLERLEDAEALQMLKKVRERPLEYIKFEENGGQSYYGCETLYFRI